jgi:predicted aspartyl protease
LVVGVLDLRPFAVKLNAPIAGILGQNFLAMADIEIDFDANLLRLSAARSVTAPRVFKRVKIDRSHDQLLIEARLEGVPVATILDIGAGQSAINWKAASAVGVTHSSPGLQKAAPILGADNRLIEAVSRKLRHIQIADVDFLDPVIVIADLPIFSAIGLADRPSMVLGIEQLRGRKIVLKLADSELLIGPLQRPRRK